MSEIEGHSRPHSLAPLPSLALPLAPSPSLCGAEAGRGGALAMQRGWQSTETTREKGGNLCT